jgi:hypothetical protein
MELWTDYEGKTIDGVFPLNKLVAPEGRSAFFSTANGNGDPTLIRLIESHFDADEILARWHGVQALGHPNLLRLERYDQVAIDGTTVIYAVMEPVEANLAAVVNSQRLTVQDTMQLAASLTSALDVLHTHGFVHEHVEPANIFAVGDVVKLRSDCIREAPEVEEGAKAKRRDIHDLGVVLLQALTQERTLEAAARDLPLPSPFDHIVRKSISGEWGIAEIQAALQTRKRPSPPAAAPAPAPSRTTGSQPPDAAAIPNASPQATVREPARRNDTPSRDNLLLPEEDEARNPAMRKGSIIAIALVVVLGLWLGWHFARTGSANDKTIPPQNAPSATTTQPAPPTAAPPPAAKPNAGAGSVHHAAQANSPTSTHTQWRVIAYTYNREDQARNKSETIAAKNPELHPDVFTPSGHAPYLVTVGGVMTRDNAIAFALKARQLGLPGDTYAQNYSGAR